MKWRSYVRYLSALYKIEQFSSWFCLTIIGVTSVSTVRVLVAEDHMQFRQFISATLSKKGNLQIICEVEDGLEAVRKVEELNPDLVLLDIGLPTVNGIAAARLIRKLAPESKIIFVTTESSVDVVQEAFNLGATGLSDESNVRGRSMACRGSRYLGKAVCRSHITR